MFPMMFTRRTCFEVFIDGKHDFKSVSGPGFCFYVRRTFGTYWNAWHDRLNRIYIIGSRAWSLDVLWPGMTTEPWFNFGWLRGFALWHCFLFAKLMSTLFMIRFCMCRSGWGPNSCSSSSQVAGQNDTVHAWKHVSGVWTAWLLPRYLPQNRTLQLAPDGVWWWLAWQLCMASASIPLSPCRWMQLLRGSLCFWVGGLADLTLRNGSQF